MVNCKEYTKIIKAKLKDETKGFKSKPKIAVIQIGNNPSSNSYIKGKQKDCEEIGIEFKLYKLNEESTSTYNLIGLIADLNLDSSINGIILQHPVPNNIDVKLVQNCIDDCKDIDGSKNNGLFDPCTPKGAIDYLKFNHYNFTGVNATVVGRSEIVGKPLAKMLLDLDCTVTICHSKTDKEDLPMLMHGSDIVFTCIDKIEFFGEEYFSPWIDVIDFGLGLGEDGKLHGNLNRNAVDMLKNIQKYTANDQIIISGTGGTGLLTRIALMCNTVKAYQIMNGLTVSEWLK